LLNGQSQSSRVVQSGMETLACACETHASWSLWQASSRGTASCTQEYSPPSVMLPAYAAVSVLAPPRQGVHPGRLVVNKPDLAPPFEPRQPAACTCPPPSCSLHCSPQPRQPRCRCARTGFRISANPQPTSAARRAMHQSAVVCLRHAPMSGIRILAHAYWLYQRSWDKPCMLCLRQSVRSRGGAAAVRRPVRVRNTGQPRLDRRPGDLPALHPAPRLAGRLAAAAGAARAGGRWRAARRSPRPGLCALCLLTRWRHSRAAGKAAAHVHSSTVQLVQLGAADRSQPCVPRGALSPVTARSAYRARTAGSRAPLRRAARRRLTPRALGRAAGEELLCAAAAARLVALRAGPRARGRHRHVPVPVRAPAEPARPLARSH